MNVCNGGGNIILDATMVTDGSEEDSKTKLSSS